MVCRALGLVVACMVPVGLVGQDTRSADLLLSALEGDWAFELFRNDASDPSLSGVRSYRSALEGHPSLFWTETIQGRDVTITGSLGYDRVSGRFYEFGVAAAGTPELMFGEISRDGRGIEWVAPGDAGGEPHGVLRWVAEDRLEFISRTYRVVFRRATPARRTGTMRP